MAYRYVNSRGVPWYLHGTDVRMPDGSPWIYYFLLPCGYERWLQEQ